jgi:hypothetical protein
MNKISVLDLKKVCKILHIKNISTEKKNTIFNLVNEKISCMKIQRWIRKIYQKGERCPISLESITYPCYAFKIKTSIFTYYNIDVLKKYLIESGNFIDPISRIPYTERNLNDIDTIDKYHRSYKNYDDNFISVLKYSKNTNYYKRKHDTEHEILTFERILDMLCQDIINFLIDNSSQNNILQSADNISYTLNVIYLHNYKINFERLLSKDRNHANYIISKNIDNILQIIDSIGTTKNIVYSIIIQFLYNLKEISDL